MARTPTGRRTATTATPPASRWSRTGVAAVLTAAGLVVVGIGSQPATAAAWSVQATPDPAGSSSARLTATSCASPISCVAVGYYVDSGGATRPLAEQRIGNSWRLRAPVKPRGSTQAALQGVSCAVDGGCVAVGSYRASTGTKTFAERWDGTSWTLERTPTPRGALSSNLAAIGCGPTGTCLAVGSYRDAAGTTVTLAESRKNSVWTIAKPVNRAGARANVLQSVSCPDTTCTAVGFDTNSSGTTGTLIETWDGAAWTLRTSPNKAGAGSSYLVAVSCSAAAACTAVGVYTDTSGTTFALGETWDGTAWAIHLPTNPSSARSASFNAVACTEPDSCTAVGELTANDGTSSGLAQTWNGARWAVLPSPDVAPLLASSLAGVSCTAPAHCAAVGWGRNSAGQYVTLAEALSPSWAVEPSPNPVMTSASVTGVSCSASDACTAVGTYTGRNPYDNDPLPYAERWDGTGWTVQAIPTPAAALSAYLVGVSCPTRDACTAVGWYETNTALAGMFAAVWDGTGWTVQAIAPPAGVDDAELTGVTCLAADECVAVGYYYDPSSQRYIGLVERASGGTWARDPITLPAGNTGSYLSGVSCPSASACTAVGSYVLSDGTGVTMAADWTAAAGWTIEATPDPAGTTASSLTAVSCAAADTCVAVGHSEVDPSLGESVALAEVWDGSAWTIHDTPVPAHTYSSQLAAVSCSSNGVCTAVGARNRSTLAERWDGSGFSLQSTPNPGPPDSFAAVSCATDTACVAVGDESPAGPLAAAWNGSAWRDQPVPSPLGTGGVEVTGLSCATSQDCVVVGSYPDAGGTVPFAERRTAAGWVVDAAALPAGYPNSDFSDVSCSSTTACTAVGDALTGGDGDATLAERWNGSTWTIQPTPNASGNNTLTGVSCPSATVCLAVGSTTSATFAERWNGSAWVVQSTPNAPGCCATRLAGISCPAVNACFAVGSHIDNSGMAATVAQRWDGSSWTLVPIPDPSGGSNALARISCATRNACVAVGRHVDSTTQAATPLLERWDGTSWKLANLSPPLGAASSDFGSVSCPSATSCTAVGRYTSGSTTVPYAEVWDGTHWTLVDVASPDDGQLQYLSGVAAEADGTATAVGAYIKTDGALVTLAERFP